MSRALKCPNANCPYLFDPTKVPPGVVLACPRCGMRFTLGVPAASQPPQPASASPPVEAAFGEMTPEAAKPDDERGLRRPVRANPYQTPLLVGVAAVALAAAGIVVWVKIGRRDEPTGSAPATVETYKDRNLTVPVPPAPWVRDDETRRTLGPPFFLAYRRDNPEAFIAFGGKDYDPRSPRPSELRNGLTEAFGKLFDPGSLKQYPEPIEGKWLGQDAAGFKFTALLKKGGSVEGEAVAVAHKGIGYWFLAWTGANEIYEEQKSAFADARKHSKLLDLRDGWKEKQSSVARYVNNDIGYSIVDAEGVWKENTNADDLKFDGADKILTTTRGKREHLPHRGFLHVYIRPDADDPLASAKQFVIDKWAEQVKSANPDLTPEFRERTDAPVDAPPGDVAPPSPVVRLQSVVKDAASLSRLHVISAAKVGDKVVVVHAWCGWADRDEFEGLFMQIAGSLQPSG